MSSKRPVFPYAIGGAIAYGFWGVPRGTRDLDVDVFLPAERADVAVEALIADGLQIDRAVARRTALERGDARGRYDEIPVDLFFLSIPLHESAAQRTVQVTLLGTPIRVLSAEDLTVFKLLVRQVAASRVARSFTRASPASQLRGAAFDLDGVGALRRGTAGRTPAPSTTYRP